MGSTTSLAVIEADVAGWAGRALDLVAIEDEPNIVTFAEAIDNRRYAIGKLGKFTLVTAPKIPEHAGWKKLSKEGRVVAFDLSDRSESNCLYIYEDGKQVIKRQEGGKPWSPRHPFERLAKVKATDHRADFIRGVFKRFTGMELDAAELQTATMKLYVGRNADHDAADVNELVEGLERALAEPLPTTGDWVELEWSNRRSATLEQMFQIWAIDPETAKTWVPAVLTDVERWPARQRVLPVAHYERIVSGKATELDALLAPAWRRLKIDYSARSPKFRPTISHRFFDHPIASELDHLDLGHTHWPVEAALLVARSTRLANLEYLGLDRMHTGDEGIAALAHATQFGKLRRLNLYACQMTKASLPALSHAAFAPQLEALSIGGNKLGVDIESLARFSSLKWLSLGVDKTVDADAVITLLASGALPSLAQLDLGETSVADAAPVAALRPGLVVHTEWTPLLRD